MKFRVFISSVQSEFAEARQELKSFLLNDPLLMEFVGSVFLFENEPAAAQNPAGVYLDEIKRSDIYIGIFGTQYGYNVPKGEKSPTEKEYDAATKKGIPQWVYFFDQSNTVDPRMAALRSRVDAEHKRRRVGSSTELVKQVYATFVQYLRERQVAANTVPNTVPCGTLNGTLNDVEAFFNAIAQYPGHRIPFFVDRLGKGERTLKRYLVEALKDRVEFRGSSRTGGYYVKESSHD